MIVCKVCGTENEQGASFCGSCGTFLEWNSEVVPPEAPAAPPAPAMPAPPTPATPAPAVAAPTTGASDVPAPAAPDPAPPGAIICPACGQPNEPTRVFCKRCATELAPVSAAAIPVPAVAPRPRSVPPTAILGGIAGVVLLGALAAFVLLPKGAGPSAPGTSPSAPASVSPGPTGSGDTGGTGGSPSAPSAPSALPSTAPSPAPPTGLVVFSALKDGDADLWIWDPADGGVRRLLKAAGNQTDPAWSPDGSTVVYRDPSGLRMVTVSGQPATPPDFTHHAQDRHPAWSPDGATIVFSTNRAPYTDLNIVTRPAADNQAPVTLLVGSKGNDWDPQWSPDGSRIVFVSARLGDSHLFLMNSDGTQQVEVPLGKGIFDDPMFSPDGNWLSFTRRDSAATPKALYVARVDGTEMRRLTHSDANENDMAWSPDGRYIAVSRADAAYKIVLVEVATGREVTTFGVDGAHNQVPDWWWPRP